MMRSIKLEKIFPLHGAIRRRGRLRPSGEKYEPRNPDAERFPEIWSGSGEAHKKARDHGLKLVEMRNVSLRFGEKVIFGDLNLAVKKHERFVLMGPSGTGKSTLLKLIVATLRPDSGRPTAQPGSYACWPPEVESVSVTHGDDLSVFGLDQLTERSRQSRSAAGGNHTENPK